MKYRIFNLIFITFFITSCGSTVQQKQTNSHATQKKDLLSLQKVYQKIVVGMTREEIEVLLGTPDHSPTKGKYYYAPSQRSQSVSEDESFIIGIIIDYRSVNGNETGSVQNFWMGELKGYKTMLSSH